jgi:hypothetical protein
VPPPLLPFPEAEKVTRYEDHAFQLNATRFLDAYVGDVGMLPKSGLA